VLRHQHTDGEELHRQPLRGSGQGHAGERSKGSGRPRHGSAIATSPALTGKNHWTETRPKLRGGCPSWIRIEPCAAPRNPLFGGFWRISERCVLADNHLSDVAHAVEFENAIGMERVLSARLPRRIRLTITGGLFCGFRAQNL